MTFKSISYILIKINSKLKIICIFGTNYLILVITSFKEGVYSFISNNLDILTTS